MSKEEADNKQLSLKNLKIQSYYIINCSFSDYPKKCPLYIPRLILCRTINHKKVIYNTPNSLEKIGSFIHTDFKKELKLNLYLEKPKFLIGLINSHVIIVIYFIICSFLNEQYDHYLKFKFKKQFHFLLVQYALYNHIQALRIKLDNNTIINKEAKIIIFNFDIKELNGWDEVLSSIYFIDD